MARVSENEVKRIMDTTLAVDALAPFVTAAHNLIDDVLDGQGYSIAQLRDIEMWLAAHFAAVKDPLIEQEKTGDTTTKYQRKVGDGLNSTEYGRRVMLLEHRGILAGLAVSKGSATIEHITEPD